MTNMDGSDEFAEVDMTEDEFDQAMSAGEPVTATSWRDNVLPAAPWRETLSTGGTVSGGRPARALHMEATVGALAGAQPA